jgi:nucleoside-diphosphate-sugar epimerase
VHGVVYRKDRALARFIFGELLGPGSSDGGIATDWLNSFVRRGYTIQQTGGASITDARDVALAMIAAAERGLSGEFDVTGPFVSFDELSDVIAGIAPSRTSVALPELGVSFRPVEETVLDAVAWQRSRAQAMVA